MKYAADHAAADHARAQRVYTNLDGPSSFDMALVEVTTAPLAEA
jgi:hypothetical protein